MTERRLTAIVLAAGQGTRMRSTDRSPSTSSVAARWWCTCSTPSASVERPSSCRSRRPAGDQEGPGRGSRPPLDFIEQRVQRGTGDAVIVGITAFADDDDDTSTSRAPRRHPAAASATFARLSRPPGRCGVTILTAHSTTRPATAGWSAARTARRPGRRAGRRHPRGARDPRVNTSIYCFRRDLLAPALRRVTPETPRASTT